MAQAGWPASRRSTTSAEKVEKVVRPPRKPVMAKSFQASEKCVLMWNSPTATPTR